jgi:signal transduction histidine kinase
MTTETVYVLLGLTAIVAVLCGVLAFAVAQFVWSSREARGLGTGGKKDTSLVMSAVSDALARSGMAGAGGRLDAASAAWYRELTALLADETRELTTRVGAASESSSTGAEAPGPDARRSACATELAALDTLAGAAARLSSHARREIAVDLRAVIEQAVTDARSATRRRGGDLLIEGVFSSTSCDPPLLGSAFAALVRRALSACESAGVAPVIVITGHPGRDNDPLAVTLADNGTAPETDGSSLMIDEAASAVGRFDDLERLLVERIIARHQGTLVFGTSAMGGTRVEVTLPGPTSA